MKHLRTTETSPPTPVRPPTRRANSPPPPPRESSATCAMGAMRGATAEAEDEDRACIRGQHRPGHHRHDSSGFTCSVHPSAPEQEDQRPRAPASRTRKSRAGLPCTVQHPGATKAAAHQKAPNAAAAAQTSRMLLSAWVRSCQGRGGGVPGGMGRPYICLIFSRIADIPPAASPMR